jgi:hypothetical protein
LVSVDREGTLRIDLRRAAKIEAADAVKSDCGDRSGVKSLVLAATT